ncbi:MAG: fused MFS/spermidine synthase, partial [Holophagales bacterium]|nr:fused MFS/spermidine synthase [Holophagales bacterium]
MTSSPDPPPIPRPRSSALASLRFYTVVVLPATMLMALEMVSSRLLAPEFGNSVYVWGSIISVFLAAMSLGYAIGGHLADRRSRLHTLGILLLLATLSQALVLYFGRPAVAWLGELTGGSSGGTLLATTVLFGPPTVLLATVSPFVVRLAASKLELLGNTAGRLFALSTMGSLAGTLGATFVLIPSLSLDGIFRLLAFGTLLASALAFLEKPILSAGNAKALAAVLAVAVILILPLPSFDGDGAGYTVLEERITPYQTLKVVDWGSVISLYSDNTTHGGMRKADGRPAVAYVTHAASALLLRPDIESVLLLGMGSGSVGTYLRSPKPHLEGEFA